MLLPACATEPQTRTVTVFECIQLEPPPLSVVDALEAAAKTDPDAGHWVVELEKHYQAIEACTAAR